jgi:Transglutaminase-like superfamily
VTDRRFSTVVVAVRLAPRVVIDLHITDRRLKRLGTVRTRELAARRLTKPLSTSLTPHQLGRLVMRIGHHRVLGRSCLRRAIVLWTMVERSGHHADLRIGGTNASGHFEAHAWVEVEGAVIGEPSSVAGFVPFSAIT